MKKRKVSANKRLSKSVLENVWPQERDFFERPDRLRYVRKLVPTKGCVFCQSRDQGIGFESLCLWQGKHSFIVLNKYPYNTGHLLILPRRHVGDLGELSKPELYEIAEETQNSLKRLKKVYSCEGFNIGLNHGAVAGAGIPEHLHWHIVPRWKGDTNFFPLIAETKVLPETLEQSYTKLKEQFT